VTQATNSHDADATRRFDVHCQGIEDGDASTKQRTSLREVEGVQAAGLPRPNANDVAGKSSSMARDRRHGPRHTGVDPHETALGRAVHATASSPPIPTRLATFSPLAADPTALTRPTASCPSTAGFGEKFHSLSASIRRSDISHSSNSTSTSTSSAPMVRDQSAAEPSLLPGCRCNPCVD